jgi:diguanylate cyclase (GGDEF)-like protein
LCIIDVDLFKPINDRYGHIQGDHVLRQIAGILRSHVRSEDIAARIGGEEFALLLPECDLATGRHHAGRLREAVANAAFSVAGDALTITISIGVAVLAAGRDSRSSLMAAADAALYRAKHEGRNRVCVEL